MGWFRYNPVTTPWMLQFVDLEQEQTGNRKWPRAQNGSDNLRRSFSGAISSRGKGVRGRDIPAAQQCT